MPVIDSFDSSTPEQKLAEDSLGKFDYAQVLEALKHTPAASITLVENVFARCAKRHFVQLLKGEDGNVRFTGDPPLFQPVWVASLSSTVLLEKLNVELLKKLTESFASMMIFIRGGRPVFLGTPIEVRVIETSADMLTFRLKQQWCIDG